MTNDAVEAVMTMLEQANVVLPDPNGLRDLAAEIIHRVRVESGRAGGSATTEKKRAASRANGAKRRARVPHEADHD